MRSEVHERYKYDGKICSLDCTTYLYLSIHFCCNMNIVCTAILCVVYILIMSNFPPFEPIEYQNHHEYWILMYELNSIIPPHEVRSYVALHQDKRVVTPPEIFSKLKKWRHVRLKMNKYCAEHFTDEDSTLTMLTHPPTVAECANCFRSNYFGCADVHKIRFRKLRSSSIKAGKPRRFRHAQRKTGDNEEIYNICEQCYNHLMIPDTKQSNSYQHTWPAFIYSMLSSRDVRLKYGCNIWKLIPHEWRKWWIFISI